jgi:hypothetical protein
MNPNQLAHQLLQWNKTIADSAFEFAGSMQVQNEKLADLFFDRSPWLPEAGRDVYAIAQNSYQIGLNVWRESVDMGFIQAEKLWQFNQ